jgi:hypothetical protein
MKERVINSLTKTQFTLRKVRGADAGQTTGNEAETDDWPTSKYVNDLGRQEIGGHFDDAADEEHQMGVAHQRSRIQRQSVVDQTVGKPAIKSVRPGIIHKNEIMEQRN